MKTTVADIVDLWNRMPSHIFRQWMIDNYDRLINETSPKEPSECVHPWESLQQTDWGLDCMLCGKTVVSNTNSKPKEPSKSADKIFTLENAQEISGYSFAVGLENPPIESGKQYCLKYIQDMINKYAQQSNKPVVTEEEIEQMAKDLVQAPFVSPKWGMFIDGFKKDFCFYFGYMFLLNIYLLMVFLILSHQHYI